MIDRIRHALLRIPVEYALFAIVFLTGGAILVIEIAATRILSPYYGNTIYSVSAVISVILGALALGYAHGGKRADRTPTFEAFFGIIEKSGIALILLSILALFALPVLGNFLSLRLGPLVWSVILFFPASYLLGMLSPFAIKLAQKSLPHVGLGTLSGRMFFWSTIGSIGGSLLSGFVLVPMFGTRATLIGVTVFVLTLGMLGLIFGHARAKRKERILRFILLLFFVAFLAQLSHGAIDPRVRHAEDGIYEKLTVIDLPHAGRPARFLLHDRGSSGAMFLDGDDHAFPYTRYIELTEVLEGKVERALVLGGGIYTMPKALYRSFPNATIDVVDIEPKLLSLSKKYFALPDSPRLRSYFMDGRRFLTESEGGYDVIVSDVYRSIYSIPTHFTTREFLRTAQERLSPHGIFIANVIGSFAREGVSLIFSEIRTMQEVFPVVYAFGVEDPKEEGLQNIILVGMNEEHTPLSERLARATNPFLRTLPEHIYDLAHIPDRPYPTLTDDHAPIDHLVLPLFHMPAVPDLHPATSTPLAFSGDSAMAHITRIVSLGTRAIGTKGNMEVRALIKDHLHGADFLVESDPFIHRTASGTEVLIENVIGRLNPNIDSRIILGTHYDSIAYAYRDPVDPKGYMPGANNSASGVALLLEALPEIRRIAGTTTGIDIVFFDGEEGEQALGAGDATWSALGSTHFARGLSRWYPSTRPHHAVIFDMVCDADLKIYREHASEISAGALAERFFSIGGAIANGTFMHTVRHHVLDDHTALIHAGIPSFLVIDFDYEPWWNTREDTPERCSARSLEIVGKTLLHYLRSHPERHTL